MRRLILAVVVMLGLGLVGCSMGSVKETYEVTPSASKAIGQGSQYRYQRQAAPCPFLQNTLVRVEGRIYTYRQAPDGTITLTPLEIEP